MSVMAPAAGADFATQWNNTVRLLNQVNKQLATMQAGAVVVTNPNANPTSPTVPVAVQPPDGPSVGLDPVTGQPLPGTPPIILQQGVFPVTDLAVTSSAYFNDVYAEVTWEVSPESNAIFFQVMWGLIAADGTVDVVGTQFTSGNSLRLSGLLPNTEYGVQVVASNVVGQAMSTPPNGFFTFETTNDATIPPPVSENGAVTVASGATSVIVQFTPLTTQQAADVANGTGMYLVQITNDPTFTTITRQVETGAWVVAFNDIYPNTTLALPISAGAGAGTIETFQDLSQVTPGQQFTALIDDEYIIFNAPSGNTATIAQRNAGLAPLTTGPESHAAGAKVTFSTQTTWYARVAAIDTSGNQSAWTNSIGMKAGGVTDSMIVGDISAAHVTFGLMQGNRIEVNSLQAGAISTGSISSAQITLNGGSFIAGNPPTTGMILNSQGITLYDAGAITVNLNAVTGSASFSGTISASTVSGSTLTGNTVTGGIVETTGGIVSLQTDYLQIKDGAGHIRMAMGYLSGYGGYYNFVWSPDGSIQGEILPSISSYSTFGQNVTSTSPATLAGMPAQVTAYLGASGDALVTANFQANIFTGGGSIYFGLILDGVITAQISHFGGANISSPVSLRFPLKAFLAANGYAAPTPNANHTFSISFSIDAGTTGGVGGGVLVVEPF